MNGAGRTPDQHRASPASQQARFSPFLAHESPVLSHGLHQTGVRTLQEIEAEMRIAAQQSRGQAAAVTAAAAAQRQEQQQQQQQLLIQKQQEEARQEAGILFQQQQEQELLRQRLQFQQQHEQQQLQLQRLLAQQQMRTPPPRMLPVSQSPRFHEHQQRQILLLQQQQEQQQQMRLQELQEQLRFEDMERQMVARMQATRLGNHPSHVEQMDHRRQGSNPSLAEMQLLQHQQQLLREQESRQRSRSPAVRNNNHNGNYAAPVQESIPYLPQNFHAQQKLLMDLTQAELYGGMHGGTPAEQESLRVEAMRKIVEAEKMEEKRRRKAAKIAHMVCILFFENEWIVR